MAWPGQELVNAAGVRLVFEETSDSTGGELVLVRAFHPAKGEKPPEHYHPFQEERFEVASGRVTVRLDGRERTHAAGERFSVSPEVVHTMWNAGPEPAELVWETRPALKTDALLERLWGLPDKPGPLELAVVARAYDDEFRLPRPPRAVQRVLFGALAALGRLRGHRP
jgi:quercetin dioxygenase-like cupin family protein